MSTSSTPPTLRDAFSAIPEDEAVAFTLVRPRGTHIPADDATEVLIPTRHQQGIQRNAAGNYFVTGSGNDIGYFYVTDTLNDHNPRQIICVVQPERTNADGDVCDHAGGCQLTEDILGFGYERYETGEQGTSKVLFYDCRTPSNPVVMEHLTIARDNPNSTAGSVAFCRYNGGWLLLVANWNANRLDFYECANADLHDVTARFKPTRSWSDKSNGLDGGVDKNWGQYQNLNLFQLSDGRLYFIAMWSGSTQAKDDKVELPDWADLYRLTYSSDDFPSISKVDKKHFVRNEDGPRFEYASGAYWNPDVGYLEIFDCEARLSGDDGTVNRCNLWTPKPHPKGLK